MTSGSSPPSSSNGSRAAQRDRGDVRGRATLSGQPVRAAWLASALALLVLLCPWPGRQARAFAGTGATPAPSTGSELTSVPVGTRTLRFLDASRLARPLHGRPRARTLVTILRYPALGISGALDIPDAPPALATGPSPLVVFAHGFAVTPSTYSRLLQSWARAGYVVAAPVFPLESAGAPGGPDESDLVNEPADVSFVITQLLALSANPASPLYGLIDPTRIAVAGQSDGAEAALAVAYSRRLRDPRVRAAIILSGAEMSGIGGYSFAAGAPPLLAAQGTADTSNEPRFTYAYFRAARRPKYLLRLLGAEHLPPYTYEQPQLGIVERMSAAFLGDYLGSAPPSPQQLTTLASVPGVTSLTADP